MGQNVKMIAGGLALFILGGVFVYFISRPDTVTSPPEQADYAPATTAIPASAATATATSNSTESFYQAADARREQHLADKAETDRLAKLKVTKERSVECKFWKQQQKTSSAAAKIDEKINEHCNLPSASNASASSATSDADISSSLAAE